MDRARPWLRAVRRTRKPDRRSLGGGRRASPQARPRDGTGSRGICHAGRKASHERHAGGASGAAGRRRRWPARPSQSPIGGAGGRSGSSRNSPTAAESRRLRTRFSTGLAACQKLSTSEASTYNCPRSASMISDATAEDHTRRHQSWVGSDHGPPQAGSSRVSTFVGICKVRAAGVMLRRRRCSGGFANGPSKSGPPQVANGVRFQDRRTRTQGQATATVMDPTSPTLDSCPSQWSADHRVCL